MINYQTGDILKFEIDDDYSVNVFYRLGVEDCNIEYYLENTDTLYWKYIYGESVKKNKSIKNYIKHKVNGFYEKGEFDKYIKEFDTEMEIISKVYEE